MANEAREHLAALLGKSVVADAPLPAIPAITVLSDGLPDDAPIMVLSRLRWHLYPGEIIQAVAETKQQFFDRGYAFVTDRRLLLARHSDLENEGRLERDVPTRDVRYVRTRSDGPGDGPEIDVITVRDDLTLRLGKWAGQGASRPAWPPDLSIAGENLVVLLGHADYYPQFGFRPASSFGIQDAFEVTDENIDGDHPGRVTAGADRGDPLPGRIRDLTPVAAPWERVYGSERGVVQLPAAPDVALGRAIQPDARRATLKGSNKLAGSLALTPCIHETV
jgi:hypothetical protein